jgi:hypothetical protein
MREREQRQRNRRGSGSATEATLETVESAALVAAMGLQGYTTVRAAKQVPQTFLSRPLGLSCALVQQEGPPGLA